MRPDCQHGGERLPIQIKEDATQTDQCKRGITLRTMLRKNKVGEV